MECSIQIGQFTVHSLSNNANINFQATYQNSHTANSKIQGGCYNFGDYASFSCCEKNNCYCTAAENTEATD